MKVKAFNIRRPTTNLVPDSKYQLTNEQMKSGFMGVFTWSYPGEARKTMMKIVLGSFMDTATIRLSKEPRATSQEERAARRDRLARVRDFESGRVDTHLAQYTSLRKVNGADPHFLLSLPILAFESASTLNVVTSIFGSGDAMVDDVDNLEAIIEAGDRRYPIKQALSRAHLPAAAALMFSQAATAVVFKSGGGKTIASIEFKITQTEAESLVSSDWLSIRPVDLYPLFMMWVESEYVSKSYGKSAISLSKIAKTLPPVEVEDRRVDQHNLAIDLAGQPLYLPSECNRTDLYESMFASVGESEDGDFRFMDVNTRTTPPRLPINIPILIDWVNSKFTYSNSAGRPVIMPLENVRKCTPQAAMNILNRPMPSRFLERMAVYAQALGKTGTVTLSDSDLNSEWYAPAANRVGRRNVVSLKEYTQVLNLLYPDTDIRYRDLMEGELPAFGPVQRFLKELIPVAFANIEALNAKYAVSTVIGGDLLGILGVMYYYGNGPILAETTAQANSNTRAAKGQHVDPNWTPPAMPLVTTAFSKEDGGMLPHQAKVRNLLRDSPDNAVLSVAAGGGKSMLSITDVLYEIKAERSAPYLVMCPGHLVANYVAEFVEFTDGKVNVIPVTSYNIRITGYERFDDIISKAPLNTVLVVDYGVLKFRAKSAVYGTSSVSIYPVVEMIRKFKPGYVMLDESHFLKNAQSATFKSVMNLITDIPKKRIASGTLNPDSPSDLPAQMAILDPTILGTREDFNNTYGEQVSGNRVLKWRQNGKNSVSSVMGKVKDNVVWCEAKRKEWACALPPRSDRFINVELSETQRAVYDAIFDDMIQQIRKNAETDKAARKLLDSLTGTKSSQQDEDDFGDVGGDEDLLDDEGDVGPGLQPYLADIERFVTNPAFHPYAKNGYVTSDGKVIPPLSGDDLMPPKARVLKQLMLTDYDLLSTSGGKTLVFVNYSESAESIYNAMPDNIKACGILYSASNKTELVNKFKKDPKIRWMIGIRRSLEVGLNLQIASNLVRLEGVWTPGEQEQGDSRIERPNFGPEGDKRAMLRFDTIVANQTIDITKAARLRAKMVALAKFENVGNPNYEALEDIPIIPMKLDAIKTMNNFETNLAAYQSVMAELNQITKDEYAEYREKILAAGGFKFTQVEQAPPPPGCAILARVPYAQGTELYKASEMGLIRVDNYLGTVINDDDEEEDSTSEDASEESKLIREKLLGLPCHTEYGEGVIEGIMVKNGVVRRIQVRLNDGTTARALRATSVFIMTRSETNSIDMRNKLAQAAGMDVTAEITVPGSNVKQTRITMKEQREAERREQEAIKERQRRNKAEQKAKKVSVSLQLNIINGYLQVGYVPGANEEVNKAMEGLGFKQNPKYYYARIKTYRQLLTQAQNWADAGFTISDKYDSGALAALSVALTQNGLQSHRHYTNLMGTAQFRNYMRQTFRPSADKKMLNMFAIVTDGGWADSLNQRNADKKQEQTGERARPAYGLAYLCLPMGGGHPASRLAIQTKYSAPGTRWYASQEMLTKFVGTLRGVHKIIDQLHDAGIKIANVDELNKYARSVKKVIPKTDVFEEVMGMETEEEAPKRTRKAR